MIVSSDWLGMLVTRAAALKTKAAAALKRRNRARLEAWILTEGTQTRRRLAGGLPSSPRTVAPEAQAGGAWVGVGKKTYQKLEEIQSEYLRMIYSCPPSTPKPSLRSQAGMVSMKHHIWLEKVCVVARILHIGKEKENYARDVLLEQIEQGWQGLTGEVADICQQTGLPNVCVEYLRREDVEEAIVTHHLMKIKKEMEPLSKLDKIKNQDTRSMQDYMKQKSLENSRLEFLWETNMIDTRMNMKGRYKKNQYEIPHCQEGSQSGVLETSEHLLSCSSYADLREGTNPDLVMEERVVYLRRVIARRKVLEQQLRARRPEEQEE